ncbi:hypothetical protein SCP_1004850 [Sparassis crispa]|uniref:Uncharacterized protein n=1 Tax=Sparassis crispa TaxID=139825 RepID=A0A401GYD8_9APHY|nr:hypothetical protein SCP_1004850 [Sparassis crispa]GBE87238.1 hypothetical protein SCP_1004850 [Sparassis crispa]
MVDVCEGENGERERSSARYARAIPILSLSVQPSNSSLYPPSVFPSMVSFVEDSITTELQSLPALCAVRSPSRQEIEGLDYNCPLSTGLLVNATSDHSKTTTMSFRYITSPSDIAALDWIERTYAPAIHEIDVMRRPYVAWLVHFLGI